jgi:hypothetical protein
MRQFNLTPEHLDQQDQNGLTAMIEDYLETADAEKRFADLPATNPLSRVYPGDISEWRSGYLSGLRRSNLGSMYSTTERVEVDSYTIGLAFFDYETGDTERAWSADNTKRFESIRAMPHDLPILTGALAVRMFNLYRPYFEYPEEFGYLDVLSMAQHVSAATALRAELKGEARMWWQQDMNKVAVESADGVSESLEIGFIGNEYLSIRKMKYFEVGSRTPVVQKQVDFSPLAIESQVHIGASGAAPKMVGNVIAFMQYAEISYSDQRQIVLRALRRAREQSGDTYQTPLFGEVAILFDGEIEREASDILRGIDVSRAGGRFHRDASLDTYSPSMYDVLAADPSWSENFVRIQFDRKQSGKMSVMRISQGNVDDSYYHKGESKFCITSEMELSIEGVEALLTGIILANQRTSTDTHPEVIGMMFKKRYGIEPTTDFDSIGRQKF